MDQHVIEGGVAIIKCEVGNQAGRVQWAKDGFVLGEYSTHFLCSWVLLRSLGGSIDDLNDVGVSGPDHIFCCVYGLTGVRTASS